MRNIVLASGSPRRKELLQRMGLQFTVAPSKFEEYLDDSREASVVAMELAAGKALEVATDYPEALIIGSDTIVTLHGKQLGKQPDADTARKLLRRMSGEVVEVFTAVALVCQQTGLQDVRCARGAIVYAHYGEREIDAFLASNDWQDKAGATAIQSPLTPPVDHIEGDPDTVLGLSTTLLAEMLHAHGIHTKSLPPDIDLRHRRLA